jgi:hypothetical protein
MFCLTKRRAISESDNHRLESRMRETRQSGSEGGAAFIAPSLPLSPRWVGGGFVGWGCGF